MKQLLKGDLKHFGNAFVRVYPLAFRRIFKHWDITLLAIFAIVSSFYLDEAVRDLIISIKDPVIDFLFTFGRWYGNGMPTLYLFLILYLAGLVIKNYNMRNTGVLILEAYVFSGLITLIFKSAFGRFRPYMNKGDFAFYGWNWSNNDMFSYISGHAAVSVALSTVLASSTENYFLKSFYYSLAVITCFSRIYHNQHWLSDVVSGAISAYLISRVLIAIHKEPDSDY
ncbi:MAG: phosphoesterase PA-phosphatase-like protein [Chlorobi bacterium OLB5]|nr:MAG: phosphoesterase PA-phosphatase-like protein [Chlorobi bacterium OLB5]